MTDGTPGARDRDTRGGEVDPFARSPEYASHGTRDEEAIGETPPPTAGRGAAAREARRPAGVTILAALYGIVAVLALMVAIGAIIGGAVAGFGGTGALVGLGLIVYAALAGAVAYGFFTGVKWAWYIAMGLAIVGLLGNLVGIATGEVAGNLIPLLVQGVIIWYLLKVEVQGYFGVHHGTPWRRGRPA